MADSFIPDTLVLGCGGLKGFLHLGALKILYQNNYLNNLKNIIGCSIGSIIGLLLLVGYDIEEIINNTLSSDIFTSFNQIDLFKIKEKMGILDNSLIRQQLEEMVRNKLSYIPTLEELYQFSGINFIVIGSNLTKRRMQKFSHLEFPNMSCIDVVLISSNIPGLFYQIKSGQAIYADGALTNPFPIDILDDGQHQILGLYIEANEKSFGEKGSLWWFLNSTIDLPMKVLTQNGIDNMSSNCRVISLLGPATSCYLSCSEWRKKEMVAIGESIGRKYLNLPRLDNDEELWIHYNSVDKVDNLSDVIANLLTLGKKDIKENKSLDESLEEKDYIIDFNDK